MPFYIVENEAERSFKIIHTKPPNNLALSFALYALTFSYLAFRFTLCALRFTL